MHSSFRRRWLRGLGLVCVVAAGLAASVAVGSASTDGPAASTGSTTTSTTTTSATTTTAGAPANTAPPTISGTAQDGAILTVDPGSWTNSPTSYVYQWQRCDISGGNCGAITGADSQRYTVTSADVGHRLRVLVAATNGAGQGAAASQPTSTVQASGSAPANTSLPAIAGTAKTNSALTVNQGGWSGTQPLTFTYNWQRCDSAGGHCVTIVSHSASASYKLTAADVGHTVRAQVTARNARGDSTATTTQTAVVTAAKSAQSATTIAVAQVALPNRLVIDGVRLSPNPITSRRDDVVARFHVSESHGLAVQGALVYALGLPYGWTYNAAEQRTDPTGWATITIHPTRNMPLRRSALVMFVRARKPGDNLLAGVSTRRLVQDRIR